MFIVIIFMLACNNIYNTNSAKSDNPGKNESSFKKATFLSPDNLIEQFYVGVRNHNLKLIADCMGRTDTIDLSFKKMNGLRYEILSKEFINIDDNEYRKKGDYVIKVKAIYNVDKDTLITTFNVRKVDDNWIIISYSSEVEDKMEEDIQNLPDDL